MIRTARFAYFDAAGKWHDTLQTWVEIAGTGVSVIVAVERLVVDPASIPVRPTRPA